MNLIKIFFLSIFMISSFHTNSADHAHILKGDFGWFAVTGNMQQLSDGHLFWSGEFSGTYFADDTSSSLHEAAVRCPGWNDVMISVDKSKLAGYCILKDKNGDQAVLSWSGEGKANGSGGKMLWISGTGIYAELGGKNAGTWRGFTVASWKDGYSNGWAYWSK